MIEHHRRPIPMWRRWAVLAVGVVALLGGTASEALADDVVSGGSTVAIDAPDVICTDVWAGNLTDGVTVPWTETGSKGVSVEELNAPAPVEPAPAPSRVYRFTVPDTVPLDKTIDCGEVEVYRFKSGNDDTYMMGVEPTPDSTRCKVTLQLLNADGTVKESWQTANPMGPNDRLWIGSTSGNIYFDKASPGSYRLIVTCTD
jgi:hypothetical protein